MITTPGHVLDDETPRPLRRPCRRLRPRQPLLQRGLRGAPRRRATSLMAVPTELGGLGFSLAEVCREDAPPRLPRAGHRARHQHARLLDRRRRRPLPQRATARSTWMLEEAVAGEVFAAGHGEAGNDLPVLLSTVEGRAGRRRLPVHRPQDLRLAQPGVDPARASTRWTRRDPGEPEDRPRVHAARHRRATRSTRPGTRSGMRATRSDDTILDGAFVPDRYIARVVPAGFAGADLFVARHLRLGRVRRSRASTPASPSARSTSRSRRAREAHVDRARRSDDGVPPEIQHAVAEMALELEGAMPARRATAADWSNGRRPRRAVADEARRDEVPRGRGGQARRRPGDGRLRRRRHVQEPTSSSGSTATCAAAASTRRTPRSCTRSSARPRSASSASSRAGSSAAGSGAAGSPSRNRVACGRDARRPPRSRRRDRAVPVRVRRPVPPPARAARGHATPGLRGGHHRVPLGPLRPVVLRDPARQRGRRLPHRAVPLVHRDRPPRLDGRSRAHVREHARGRCVRAAPGTGSRAAPDRGVPPPRAHPDRRRARPLPRHGAPARRARRLSGAQPADDDAGASLGHTSSRRNQASRSRPRRRPSRPRRSPRRRPSRPRRRSRVRTVSVASRSAGSTWSRTWTPVSRASPSIGSEQLPGLVQAEPGQAEHDGLAQQPHGVSSERSWSRRCYPVPTPSTHRRY